MQNRSLGGGDGNGQISGRQKQKEEIDRDRRTERKERRLFHRRNDSPPESVYLPSQPEKCHWWTHGGMRLIPIEVLLMDRQV